MAYRVSRKDVEYFGGRVRHWLRVLSLGDWKVEVYAAELDGNSGEAEMWHDAHGAHIKLQRVLRYKPDRRWLDRLALHEVGHVLLCDLKRLINERGVTAAQADTAEHAIIRRLEGVL